MLQFFVRERDTIKIYSVEEAATRPTPLDPQIALPFPEVASWAPNGRLLSLVDPNRGVMIILLSDEAGDIAVKPLPESAATTKQLHFSTKSSFLVTLHPLVDGEANMVVWNSAECVPITRFPFPRWREKHLWPAIKWSEDELLCVRFDAHTLVVMDGQTLATQHTLHTDAAPSYNIAPRQPDLPTTYRFFVYSPEVRDSDLDRTLKAKGYVELVTWDTAKASPCTVDRFMDVPSAETCEIHWAPSGKHCLLLPHVDVDESGQNYFGMSRLLVASLDGTKLEITAEAVNTGVAEPAAEVRESCANQTNLLLQAVAWSPKRDEFILITGFQPSVASLWAYDAEGCRKIWNFPERLHRNTIRWNRFGNLLALGGFGNLAGDLDFWFREDEGAEKPFVRCGSTKAECTVGCSWAPNGRHFLTAVLAPRMRVDNAVTVWRGLCGQAVHTQRFHELFEAIWKPSGAGENLTTEEIQLARSSAAKGLGDNVKRKAYRPPGARGGDDTDNTGMNTVAARMKSQQGIDDAITRRNGRVTKGKGKRDDEHGDQGTDFVKNFMNQGREHAQSFDRRDQRNDSGGKEQPHGREMGKDGNMMHHGKDGNGHHAMKGDGKDGKGQKGDKGDKGAGKGKDGKMGKDGKPRSNSPEGSDLFRALDHLSNAQENRQRTPDRDPPRQRSPQPTAARPRRNDLPNEGWAYVDTTGQVQGPFQLSEMRSWHAHGYFKPELQIRARDGDGFNSLKQLYPDASAAFLVPPSVP